MIFTGERFIPEQIVSENLAREHWHRYLWAAKFARDKNVLDIASGAGYGSRYLSEFAKDVIGGDISAEAVEYAQNTYQAANLKYEVMSSTKLPLADNSRDLIVSFETIEHMDEADQLQTVKEYRRVLKDDGILLISTPGTESPLHYAHNKFHLKECSYDEFYQMLKKYFANIEIVGQSAYNCSVIGDAAQCNEIINSKFPRFDIPVNYNVKDDKYLLAVCSNKKQAVNLSSVLIDRNMVKQYKSDDEAVDICSVARLLYCQTKIFWYVLRYKLSKNKRYLRKIEKYFHKIMPTVG